MTCSRNFSGKRILNSDLNGFSVELKSSGADCNELINGIWLVNNATNAPENGWWLIISGGDDNTRKQVACNLENTKSVKTRNCSAGILSDWYILNDWIYLGSGSYKSWVNLPSDYKELYIEALINGFAFIFNIPKKALEGTSIDNIKKFITGGYFGTDYNAYGVVLYATSTGVELDTANYNSQEQSAATLYVYYR